MANNYCHGYCGDLIQACSGWRVHRGKFYWGMDRQQAGTEPCTTSSKGAIDHMLIHKSCFFLVSKISSVISVNLILFTLFLCISCRCWMHSRNLMRGCRRQGKLLRRGMQRQRASQIGGDQLKCHTLCCTRNLTNLDWLAWVYPIVFPSRETHFASAFKSGPNSAAFKSCPDVKSLYFMTKRSKKA